MNFEPSSLIAFLTILVWLGGLYYTVKNKYWKSTGLLIFVGLVLTIFNPFSYNNNSGGYGSVERFEQPAFEQRELPEQYKAEPEVPFEMRVNRDIQKLEEERNNEND